MRFTLSMSSSGSGDVERGTCFSIVVGADVVGELGLFLGDGIGETKLPVLILRLGRGDGTGEILRRGRGDGYSFGLGDGEVVAGEVSLVGGDGIVVFVVGDAGGWRSGTG